MTSSFSPLLAFSLSPNSLLFLSTSDLGLAVPFQLALGYTPSIPFTRFIHLYFIFACMFALHYLRIWCPRGQKRILDPLELESQPVVSLHVGAGYQPGCSERITIAHTY